MASSLSEPDPGETSDAQPEAPTAEHGFAPQDLTDGRQPGQYLSRYQDKIARRSIAVESIYVAVILTAAPIGMLIVVTRSLTLGLDEAVFKTIAHYAYAWLGGMLGGCLFSVKWLYHSVAHGTWHQDRRLWRLFTPHLSAGLAFAVVLLIESGLLAVLNAAFFKDGRTVVGLAFLVGYFSDSVVAKLAELARNLFGDSRGVAKKEGDEQRQNGS
ncbi:hypothetical protein [Lentzea flaviverrucosa]|uniref:hypothetical protein n=1 Tax=Lentzea flaviverrucosa TaxID=200379 RepID=UPI0011603813|nr:hypothetical protein [Lentzea flaviverrucosa]